MSKISHEFRTILSGAEILIDEGHIEAAERILWQLWSLAKLYGSDADKEATCLALVKRNGPVKLGH